MSTTPNGWQDILEPGETVLWQGRPDGRIAWSRFEPRRVLFGTLFTGFAIFWVTTAAMAGAGDGAMAVILPLFGLPFVVIGFRLAGGDELWRAVLRRHSWYTLTDRRAFIATKMFGRRGLQSWPVTPATILDLEDGPRATIWFAERRPRPGHGKGDRRVGFVGIEDGAAVLHLMRQVQRGTA
ncbi:aspartate carbamoyltransferase catalytic subunit [Tropicimonas sp. IMCC34043]|uniref:aspartate carbamoyltransferase catalytic subunit n=1 Tax=Tropicimonas sp. IMCC34043 TaxID=2248760 RepID=UPI000E254F3E|nr:aspartate carbamoyltransferase catalytic subunit [Tropicimonas sp. IMCC34043]